MSDYSNPYSYDPSQPEIRTDASGRHPVNVAHLVMGVAFLCLAGIWLLVETDVLSSEDLRWVLPLPWLAAGVAGLAAVAMSGRRTRRGQAPAPAPAPAPVATDVEEPLL